MIFSCVKSTYIFIYIYIIPIFNYNIYSVPLSLSLSLSLNHILPKKKGGEGGTVIENLA
jgi:hypothetical protein